MSNSDPSNVDVMQDYVTGVRGYLSYDKRRKCLISLIKFVLDERLGCSKIKEEEYMGRSYLIIGNTIIDVRKDIHWHYENHRDQIKDYLIYLKAQHHERTYMTIITDGLRFHVYMPKYDESSQMLELETSRGINLTNPLITPQQGLNELRDILSNFKQDQI